ncbi:uncharacterized protein LOC129941160 isoform X2 [Eupeodes corollae]|uniref:uncharacterized protein LOC129941160 isoform X2 n=1 Tax=Eupeodes corollae TaxID=290404 RepID=UPI002491AA4C|nr:uncharacterized protein LOC129941160 isoform X2 [Eupeodes corollae]
MAPAKHPNNKTGTVPKHTQSGSSSSSSMIETSPARSSSKSSKQHINLQSKIQRTNGIDGGGGCHGGGGGHRDRDRNGAGVVQQTMSNLPAPPATHATHATTTIVPQSGGIGAVGGAMSNAYALRKNTEIVAPIRRELKDLNDYFLSVTESSQSSQLPSAKRQNHHYHHRHQPPVTPLAAGPPNNLDSTTCFEIDHFPDNQRSCYPVRPIPRRTSQTRDNDTFHYHNHSSCGVPSNNNNNNNNNNSANACNNTNQAATVGVVNPTTLGITNDDSQSHINQSSNRHSTNPFVRYRQAGHQGQHQQQQQQQVIQDQQVTAVNNDIAEIDELLLQRYKYIQYCIKLANKQQNKNKTSERAQSVTSIHSTAEPASPTYEDLQSRLEASTRNIQNMKEQQAQLIRLQDQAKQHLAEMESLRSNTTPLLRGAVGQNGAPDYETIDQVHTDMSSLVGRMKNLTTFIAGQNELSDLLGEDGPEILAEQQTLQEKLEGLKTHRDEMKNLIVELHEVNRVAEKRATEQLAQETKEDQPSGSGQRDVPARVVPVEYSRVVPIELVGAQKKNKKQTPPPQVSHTNGVSPMSNGVGQGSDDEDEENDPETSALINQKMSDIQAMKAQLNRLKSMMETVKLIEERSEGPDPKEIGGGRRAVDIPVQRESTPKITNTQPRAVGAAVPFDKDRTPVQEDFNEEPEDPVITEKIHMLNEVTRDLRSQAMSLASERDRIRALKEEIIRRKAESAALNRRQQLTVDNDDDDKNSNRESVSPSKLSNKDTRRDLLEAQYEEKKKEFQEICARIQSEEDKSAAASSNLQSRENENEIEEEEEEEEEEEDLNANDLLSQAQGPPKPDIGFYYPQSQGLSCNSSLHGAAKQLGKESADSGAVDVNGVPSCEAGSIKSGSSRSFSMPPPMRAMSNREASWHFGPPNAPSAAGSSGPAPPPLPTSWNPYYFYNAPYSPHFAPPSAGGVNSDCICQASSGVIANGAATPAATVMQSDPVLLQQFIQTQQMLINSVCQCNQMLWHQQREIDSLNSTIHMLQERLLSHTNGTDLGANHRSESVPPAGTVQNNLYPSLNRAQSEQPHPFPSLHPHAHHLPTIMSQTNSSFQRRNLCNIQQQQQQQLSNFNYSAEQQSSGSMYLNNLCAPMPPMNVFNNINGGNGGAGMNNNAGAPIFMHHHNNTQHSAVHNNNSNLLNAAQQQQQQPTPSAAVAGGQNSNVSNGVSNLAGSALNNQVPPGNRANNYWDNFRSYSRQNLLSSNSCKSNEEQNHNQIQQQQQHQQPPPLLQQQQPQPPQQQQPQQQHQPDQPNLPIFTNSLNVAYRPDSNTNNLNPPGYDNKYLHTFRNRINGNSAGLLNAAPPITTSATQTPTNYSNMMNISINQPEVPQVQSQPHPSNISAWNVVGVSNDVFESNESAQDLRNMNLNFGNNEPNKVAVKPSSLRRPPMNRRLRPTQSGPAAFVEQQQAQQPELGGDLLSPGLFSGVMHSLDTAMDDTSDEIKRNLLVNALKSEKFTTKFYESLKEDVFRRIETLLRAKDGEQQFLAQLYRDYNIASTRDPLRKLYLNEVRSLSRPTEDLNETESNNGENEDDDEDEDDEEGAQALDNHNILNNNNNEAQNALGLNAKDMKLLADKFVSSSTAGPSTSTDQTVQCPDYELIHYIIARIHEDTQPSSVINDALLVDIAKLTATAIQNYAIVKCRHKEIIEARLHISPKKIYTKLKGKSFPRDRDGFLMWYQRYLETMLFVTLKRDDDEDPRPSRENNNHNKENANQNIAPGSMSWMDIQNIYINAHQARKSNIPLRPAEASTAASEVENKIENNSSFRQQHQRPSQMSPRAPHIPGQHHLVQISTPIAPNNIMNEDLAEADQICSSSSNTMQGFVEAHADDSFILGGGPSASSSLVVESLPPASPDNAEGQLISIPLEPTNPQPNQNFLNFFLDETENNENPDDDENRHHLSIDLAVAVVDSDNAEEDGDGQNQRPESSLHGAFGTDPLAITTTTSGGGTGKRNSVP